MSKGDCDIRLAALEDVADVQRLLIELTDTLGKSAEARGTAQDIAKWGFGDNPLFEVMLAFEQGRAVGLAVFFSEYSTWRGVPGVYVQDLYVASQLRGSGLGRELLAAVKQRARSWGGSYVRLTVYDGNQEALLFYQHLGFKPCQNELPLVLVNPIDV
jgi:GNAT superfamily N-acetyltransferase